MSFNSAKQYLQQYHLEDKITVFDDSTATVALAAQALGVEEARIAKSMSFLVNEQPILIITAGDMKIANRPYKDEFKLKAKMIPYEQTESIIGHAPGGVCPFGVNSNVLIYFDESLKRFETVFPAVGSSHSCVELTIPELENCVNFEKWVNVCVQK